MQGYEVYATDYVVGDKLDSLSGKSCQTAELNVRSFESISGFASKLNGKPVDLILNVAGVMATHEDDALETVSQETLTTLFETNTFGPLLVTQSLLPNLLKSKKPRIGIVSSRVGSIGDNSSGGLYSYRASKAAVNSIGKSMAMDLKDKGVVVSLLHPGFVITGLDPSTHGLKEAVQPEEAAEKLWKLLDSKTIVDTGRFWHREGQELQW